MKTSLKKMNFHSLKLYRVFLDLLNWLNEDDFSWISILKVCSPSSKIKREIIRHKTFHKEVSRRSRTVDVKEMY